MKKLFVMVLMICGAAAAAQAQVTPQRLAQARRDVAQATDKKDRKAKEKILQQVLDSALYQNAVIALEEKSFIMKADQIMFRRGGIAHVDGNTNFISLRQDKATVQIAFNTAYPGPNGIGGITVSGRPSEVKYDKDKKGNITLSMNVFGMGISAQVTISLMAGSNRASAYVTPNFNSRTLTLYGELFPTSQTSVFKGTEF